MLLFSYLFPCCQAFYFLLITSAIEPTSVYQKTTTGFQVVCSWEFIPFRKLWCISHKKTSFICLPEKRSIQLYEVAYLKNKNITPQTDCCKRSSPSHHLLLYLITQSWQRRHLSADLLFPSHRSNSKTSQCSAWPFSHGRQETSQTLDCQSALLSYPPLAFLHIRDLI